MSKPEILSESMSDAAHADAELTASLTRIERAVDRVVEQCDRLATALRYILELAQDREGDARSRDWQQVEMWARTALGKGGQATLPAVLAGLALAIGAMWLVGWVGDHAAAGAHVLACVTRAIGG